MFGLSLRGGGFVGRRFSSVVRDRRKVAAVGGAQVRELQWYGAGLRRNGLAACNANDARVALEYGGHTLHSRCDDGWRGAQARLVHSSANNETLTSSAVQSTSLVGKDNFEKVRNELQGMDLNERVSRVIDMVDAYYEMRGRSDTRMLDQFRADVVEDVLADFKWSSLEVLMTPGNHHGSHILASFGRAPSGGFPADRLAVRAAHELNVDRERVSVENACTVISMLQYVRSPSAELLVNLNSAESLLADAVHKVESLRQVFGLLKVLGDPACIKTGGVDCSVPLLNAVYDRLTEILPEAEIDGGKKQVSDVVCASIRIYQGRVLHRQFLTAWEKFTHRLLLSESTPIIPGHSACILLHCLAYFHHPCPELVSIMLAGFESGRLPSSMLRLEKYIFLLHDLLMLNMKLPWPVVHYVVTSLNMQTMTQLPKVAQESLEQLAFFLPLSNGLFRDIMQFRHSVRYYSKNVACHFARQKVSSAAWQHVILDAVLPGGRVPLICMLSCMEKKTVLPWPEQLQPSAVSDQNVGKLPGTPIAVLVAHRRNTLREPVGTVVGITRIQAELLEERGYIVFSIVGPKAVEAAEHCSSVGELIQIAGKQ